MIYPELSKKILDAVFAVHRGLGSGLLEKCYHNALYYELRSHGLRVDYEVPFEVIWRGEVVGEYFADLIVERKVVLEIKSIRALAPEHVAQLLNYLSIAGCELGFLLNFRGTRVEFRRMVRSARGD